MLWNAASCVRLNEKNGIPSSLTGFMIIFLIVVASDEAYECFFLSSLSLRILAICLPLYRAWHWLSVMFLLDAAIGVLTMGLVCEYLGEVSVTIWYIFRWWRCVGDTILFIQADTRSRISEHRRLSWFIWKIGWGNGILKGKTPILWLRNP